MVKSTRAVDGTAIKWAREQQELTLRRVHDLGGPSIGFQSEVENARKTEVTMRVLPKWVKILGVTIGYARGDIPRYREAPAACMGMAAQVVPYVRSADVDWASLGPQRAGKVLQFIILRCASLPRVVLGYVLGLELKTLDKYISGEFLASDELIAALVALTTLSESFFKEGVVQLGDANADYSDAINLARALGISSDQLSALIRHWGGQQPDVNRPQPPAPKR